MDSFWIAVIVLIALGLFLLDYLWKPKLSLPCPMRIPLLGHALAITDKLPLDFDNWGQQFGSLYQIQLLNKNFVILNDFDILDQMIKRGVWKARMKTFRHNAIVDTDEDRMPKDIFGQDATEHQQAIKKLAWKEVVNIKHSPLFEAVGLLAYRNLVNQIKWQSVDNNLDPFEIIRDECSKFLYGLVKGKPIQNNDPNLEKMFNLMEILREDLNLKNAELEIMPWLKYTGHKGYQRLKASNKIKKELYADVITDMQANGLKEGMGPGFIIAAEKLDLPDSVKANVVWGDLFIGGAVPLPSTIYAMYMILASHPEVQQRIRSETSSWFRRADQAVTAKQCYASSFTRAAVWELLRFITPIPLMPRSAVEDAILGNITIPKGTDIFVNLYCPHHSEAKWEDPWKYKPERFLTEYGRILPAEDEKWKNLKPFGAGKNMCMGPTLVVDTLMMFTAWIVQDFQVQSVDGMEVSTDVREWPDYGLSFLPKRSQLKFVPIKKML